ncbi:hypothetical protein ACU686_16440 [Yinghuangia aomiensis]
MVAVVEFLASRPAEPATVAELVRHLGFSRATTTRCWPRSCASVGCSAIPPRRPSPRAPRSSLRPRRRVRRPRGPRRRPRTRRARPGPGPDRHHQLSQRRPHRRRQPQPRRARQQRHGPRRTTLPRSHRRTGRALVAWGTAADVDRWLARPRTDDAAIRRFHHALASVRDRGYTVESMTPLPGVWARCSPNSTHSLRASGRGHRAPPRDR